MHEFPNPKSFLSFWLEMRKYGDKEEREEAGLCTIKPQGSGNPGICTSKSQG